MSNFLYNFGYYINGEITFPIVYNIHALLLEICDDGKNENFDNDYDDDDDDCSIIFASCRFLFAFIQ